MNKLHCDAFHIPFMFDPTTINMSSLSVDHIIGNESMSCDLPTLTTHAFVTLPTSMHAVCTALCRSCMTLLQSSTSSSVRSSLGPTSCLFEGDPTSFLDHFRDVYTFAHVRFPFPVPCSSLGKERIATLMDAADEEFS